MSDKKQIKNNKKGNAKVAAQHKHRYRRWVTFVRMCRYGVNNFTRNAWLTIAATAVMTITLLVIFASVVSQQIMANTLNTIRETVSMSIYIKNDTTEEDVTTIVSDLRALSSVKSVAVESPDDARNNYIQANKQDSTSLEIIKEATNKFPWTLKIQVADINDTSELAAFVKDNQNLKPHIDTNRPPSFAGERRMTIEKIASTATFVQRVGAIVSIVFVAISTLIIFNTIRMAIFNRKEEIQMMKLIGAERSFIRGPFIVEAIVYGFFAAILASSIGFAIFSLISSPLQQAGVAVGQTTDTLTIYAGVVLLAMIVVGAIIGTISSLLATRRYLKL